MHPVTSSLDSAHFSAGARGKPWGPAEVNMRTHAAGCLLSHFEIQTLLHELKKGIAMETPCREKYGPALVCNMWTTYMGSN